MMLLGYPLFGFWLPFIGFRRLPCDGEGTPISIEADDKEAWAEFGHLVRGEQSFFVAQWLGRGLVIDVVWA